jgi:hypothetical protein
MAGDPITRSRFLTTVLASVILPPARAEQLQLSLRGQNLFVAAPTLDLLRAPILERLKNGSTVAFDFHLGLWAGSRSNFRRGAFERFVVSYDLWEERFSVTGLRNPRPSASNLVPKALAPWCLEHVSLHPIDLRDDTPVWVRLDVRASDPKKDDDRPLDGDGLTIGYLIDLLSRPSRKEPNRWALETGPVRVSSIRVAPGASR